MKCIPPVPKCQNKLFILRNHCISKIEKQIASTYVFIFQIEEKISWKCSLQSSDISLQMGEGRVKKEVRSEKYVYVLKYVSLQP